VVRLGAMSNCSSPRSDGGRSPWRRSMASPMAVPRLAIGNYNTLGASPHRGVGAPAAQVAPSWLRSFGAPFAVLCAALAGIVPFLGGAMLALMDDDSGSSPAPAQ
ncbi:unnamed protein product, partial [Polarella glacialis]